MYTLLPFFFDSFNKFALKKDTLDGVPGYILVIGYSSANILYNDYAEEYPKYHLLGMCLFVICLSSCYVFFASIKKNKLNISEFYSDILSFRTNNMHTPTIFDQTDHTRTARYDGAGSLAGIPSRNDIVAEFDNGTTSIL